MDGVAVTFLGAITSVRRFLFHTWNDKLYCSMCGTIDHAVYQYVKTYVRDTLIKARGNLNQENKTLNPNVMFHNMNVLKVQDFPFWQLWRMFLYHVLRCRAIVKRRRLQTFATNVSMFNVSRRDVTSWQYFLKWPNTCIQFMIIPIMLRMMALVLCFYSFFCCCISLLKVRQH